MDLFKRISSGCGTSGQTSCHNTTKQTNSCCFESPGGLLLQTQFWDTDPSTGPSDSWTIHGLWPDNCDGTFTENCDSSRDYTDIAGLLTAQGASDTLSFMETFWIDINGQNEQFWEHEWSTHGTCYSTLEPTCLPSGSAKGAEAVAFFNTVVKLFQQNIYTFRNNLCSQDCFWGERANIPLNSIKRISDGNAKVTPSLDCDGSSLNQISWYFNVKGSLLDGEFLPIDAAEKGSFPLEDPLLPALQGAFQQKLTFSPAALGVS
ncbi:hypothetical protein EW026_g7177 [Hermanssonia centrifuga]|uniref:ribonuclease T2 n=1 Tax=Hermanssonia centrifuga TaxID=98765 RepID=A0A4S4KAF7_9APHY|nr:hypothetical protein EW026_g7177 [Hermanssonia centrifuga]